MMDLILLIILTLITLLIYKYLDNRKYKDIEKIPGPKTVPFFGNALSFGFTPADAFKYQLELIKTYGKFVRVWLGPKLTLITCDPIKIEYILSSNEHIQKSEGYNGWKAWLGNGLIISTGNYWRRHRKIITPTFHFKILEQFMDYINSNSKIMISKLEENVGKPLVDIHHIITCYSLDVINETAMRSKINAQIDPKCEYLNAVQEYLRVLITRFFSFTKKNNTYFKLTHDYRSQQKCVKVLHNFTNNVIIARKEERKNAKSMSKKNENDMGIKKKIAFIDLLLDLQEENMLTDEEIREEIDTFMFAGHDTVSSCLSFSLLELANYPDIQNRIVEEYKSLVDDYKSAELTYYNLQNLKYLDIVVKELLRIRAPVPFFEREIQSDITFDGIVIPKGTNITIVPYALHKLEEYFEEPEKLIPERFLAENSSKRNPFTYLPFSAGPRNCIGQRYAIQSVKSALIKILINFEIHPAEPKFEPVLGNYAILKSENGIHVQLRLRK